MLNLKRMVCMLLAAGMFTTVIPVQALAASDYQYITNISLKVEVDLDAGDEINSGDSVGTSKDDSGTKVYTTSDKYRVESAEWTNNKDVSIGDTPKITVWLEPDSSSDSKYEYRFRSSYSSSKVSINGGEFVSSSKSGSNLKVVLRVKGVKGTYEAPKEAEWGSGKGKATWKAPDDKTGYYDVILYKGSTVMKKLEDYNGTSYNFYPYMTKEGDYTFKVRAVDGSDKGEWSDESDEYYMNSSDVYTGTPPTDNSSGGSTPANANGQWVNSIYGWSYYINGVPVKNNWVYVDNEWYHLNANGFMDTDWIYTDNNWFYLNPVSDGTRGKMLTGWQQIGPYKYYLNPVSDGTRGARKTGYQFIDGAWYLFDLNSGALWTNMVTPNGMVADANGVLH